MSKLDRKIYIAIIFMGIVLTGTSCINDEKKSIVNNISEEIDESNTYNKYEKELIRCIDLKSEDDEDTRYLSFCDYKDGEIGYVYCTNREIDKSDNSDEKNNSYAYKDEYFLLNINTNELKSCFTEDYHINYCFRNDDDSITEIYKKVRDKVSDTYVVKKKKNDETIFEKELIDEKFKYSSFMKMICDNNNIYLYIRYYGEAEEEDKAYIFVYDYNYNLMTTYETNYDVECMDNSGKKCIFELEYHEMYEYNPEKNEFELLYKFDFDMEETFRGDDIYDFYYIDDYYPVGDSLIKSWVGVKNGKNERIFSFQDLGIKEGSEMLFPDNEGGFFMFEYDYGQETDKVFHIKKTDKEYSIKDNKVIISLATCGDNIDEYVSAFNIQNEKYYIDIHDYTVNNEYVDAKKALYLDAQSGESIDIINVNGLEIDELKKNGVIDNLNDTYLDKGGNISKKLFVDSVIEEMTNEDGGIYSLFNEYYIKGIWGRADFELSKLENWGDAQNKLLFADAYSEENIYDFVRFSGDEYIDIDNKTTNFGGDFKNVLKILKSDIEKEDLLDDRDPHLLVQEQKAELINSYIMFPYYYLMYGYIFCDGMKNVVNNGKPVLCPGPVNLAVCSKSDKKDGVYEFLNFVFDDSNHYLITDFPALKINEEDWKDRLTATKNYINRYGNSVTVQDFQMNVGEFFCEIPSLTEDEYASYEEFIHSAEYIEPMPDKYLDIIMEEADLYFTDKKSLDDTMKSIENRVNNALNE